MTTQPVEIQSLPGDCFGDLVGKAQITAPEYSYAYFNFNGIEVRVGQLTNYQLLSRDLDTAYLLGWEVIGPTPDDQYDDDLLAEINQALQIQEQERELAEEKYQAKRKVAKDTVALAQESTGFYIIPSLRGEYEDWKSNQSDGYGLAVFELAEATAAVCIWMCNQRNTFVNDVFAQSGDIASDAVGGATGFQWSCAKQLLKRYWLYRDCI
jgi:hypothetical protein